MGCRDILGGITRLGERSMAVMRPRLKKIRRNPVVKVWVLVGDLAVAALLPRRDSVCGEMP